MTFPGSLLGLLSRGARSAARHSAVFIRISDPAWAALHAELNFWQGRQARFWWRDDDAEQPTPALQRLLDVAAEFRLPLGLAVIPAGLQDTLPALLGDFRNVTVFAHGWAHSNHARPGRPLNEYPHGRKQAEVADELARAYHRVADAFGDQFCPVLVPPYNHLAPMHVGAVRQADFRYISVDRDFSGLGLPCRNTHADVIDWRSHQAANLPTLIRGLVAALRLRRLGPVPAGRPIGILTHHRVHTPAIWDLTERLLEQLRAHPSVAFPSMDAIFP